MLDRWPHWTFNSNSVLVQVPLHSVTLFPDSSHFVPRLPSLRPCTVNDKNYGNQAIPCPSSSQITTIDVQSLAPSSSSPSSPSPDAMEGSSPPVTITGIRDPLGDSFTVSLDSGRTLRCSLPQLYRHPVGE